MKNKYILLFTLFSYVCSAQTILNAYARVTSVTGNSLLAVTDVNIANHSFTVGGMVVVMQMQDNVIGTNTTNVNSFGNLASIASAGLYEIRTIASVSPAVGTPTAVALTPGLVNTYNTGNNSRVQLISFRNMGLDYTTTGHISGLAWNGNIGGVVAFYVTNTLTLNHQILANGLGFRGGSFSNSGDGPICSAPSTTIYTANSNVLGFKGEGIYRSTNNSFNNARGKIINGGGGGNDHNAGGAGGGNYTSGGQGGNGYNNCTTFPGGGLGGLSLAAHISAGRVFMGGGGGGGQQNNAQNSSGGNGGGIILIKAEQISTSATCGASLQISANGNTATSGGNDGMGGGGAGGSIVIEANSFSVTNTCSLITRANGGSGGNSNDGAAHAGGGGGGQGVIIYSSAQPTSNVVSQTSNGTPGRDNSGGTVSAGSGGGTNGSGIVSPGSGPLPIELLDFKASPYDRYVILEWSTASEINNDFFTIEKSVNGIDFVEISRVKGNGTTRLQSNYDLVDYQPEEGLSYYRLKQTDYSGSYKYYPIISVEYSDHADFIYFPNPVSRGETISFKIKKTNANSSLHLRILDVTGKEIYSEVIRSDAEDLAEFTIESLTLSKGVYLLKLQNGGLSQTKKLLVK